MRDRLRRFLSEERSLTALLIFLILQILLVVPAEHLAGRVRFINDVVLSLILLAGIFNVWSHRLLRFAGIVLIVLTIIARWAAFALDTPPIRSAEGLLTIVSIVTITVVVFIQVNRSGPVTAHRIRGAIAGYLLIALIFTYAYAFIELTYPGAFNLPAWLPQDFVHRNEALFYFSVITLTTLGYGDITAIHPFARSLVMIEALIGQLYPAILIARLVTLEIETRRSREGK
jgi:hypothetical protein